MSGFKGGNFNNYMSCSEECQSTIQLLNECYYILSDIFDIIKSLVCNDLMSHNNTFKSYAGWHDIIKIEHIHKEMNYVITPPAHLTHQCQNSWYVFFFASPANI